MYECRTPEPRNSLQLLGSRKEIQTEEKKVDSQRYYMCVPLNNGRIKARDLARLIRYTSKVRFLFAYVYVSGLDNAPNSQDAVLLLATISVCNTY